MKYQIENNGQKLIITYEDGTPVSSRIAYDLIDNLEDAYPRPAYVYIAMQPRLYKKPIYKIGYSAQPLSKRLGQLRYAEGNSSIRMIHTIACHTTESAHDMELTLHRHFDEGRLEGEWFRLRRSDLATIMSISHEDESHMILLEHFGRWLMKHQHEFNDSEREEVVRMLRDAADRLLAD